MVVTRGITTNYVETRRSAAQRERVLAWKQWSLLRDENTNDNDKEKVIVKELQLWQFTYECSQSVWDGLGEVLMENHHLHLTTLGLAKFIERRWNEDNLQKFFLFIETSESLTTLDFGGEFLGFQDDFVRGLLLALSRRKMGLDFLDLPRIKPSCLEFFFGFLRDTPMTKNLGVHFYPWSRMRNAEALLQAAASAKIEALRLVMNGYDWGPWELLAFFQKNTHLKQVLIAFDRIAPLPIINNQPRARTLLRSCRGHYSYAISLLFDGINWDQEVWEVLSGEIEQGYDAITELAFENVNFNCRMYDAGHIMTTFFQNNKRRSLKLGGGTLLNKDMMDAIVASVVNVDLAYDQNCASGDDDGNASESNDVFSYFISASTNSTAVMESLSLQLNLRAIQEIADALVAHAPGFRSLKSLSIKLDHFGEEGGSCDYDEVVRTFVDKIKKGLWKNRSLMDSIEVTRGPRRPHYARSVINDDDRAVFKRIVERNKSLPALLESRNIMHAPPGLVPFLFQHAGETNLTELYQAIRSSSFAVIPENDNLHHHSSLPLPSRRPSK